MEGSEYNLELEIRELRQTYNSGKTKEESWRRSQLKNLLTLLMERENEICSALVHDLGKHPVESFRDEADLPLAAFPASARLVPEPLGLVLIISPWNFPFGLSLEALIGAIAAGNVVVLKPSELAPASSSALAKLIHSYLDTKAVKVIEGGASVGEQLLQQKWDKILFTGSSAVARIVMTAAAKNLTPVALELGGKCPAVVDSLSSSWAQKMAVNRILSAKFGTCAGQACVAIDYILVEKKFSSTLVDLLKAGILSMFGETTKGSDKIFGPLLPIITLEKMEDSVEFINSLPRALALYAFTNNEGLKKKISSKTSSGCIVFNDAIIQYVADSVPFGGVGESGFGRYHGKFSFDMFSHEKAITGRGFHIDFWFRYPPWNDNKLLLFRHVYRFDYLGILLVILGLKRS
ncbi:aldehyde dehydrogenase family 3 member f1 [Phtheirospermum japonicum]|uniref:Aldehyde dehydrogenase n=1 Tax=Phtheirospermum japonicum TaxID=374723 RepID=A0A830BTR5_9LAMI|nr:aldehyde dehydrogenase family 3 member f1 [Phtheirospermum japonicum]